MAARSARSVILWITVALASGWVGWYVDNATDAEPSQGETPGMLIWLTTPLLASVVFWISHRRLGFSLRPRFRGHGTAWLVAVLVFPVVTALSLGCAAALGGLDAAGLRPKALLMAVGTALVAALVKNLIEESAWRGLLVGELDRLRTGDLWVYLISGGAWGLWHVPYYLHFLRPQDSQSVLAVPRPLFAGLAALAMLAWGVLFAEVYRASGSIWPVVLMHAVEDAVTTPAFVGGHVRLSTPAAWAFSPVVGIVTSLAYAGLGLTLRHLRRTAPTGVVRLRGRHP